MSLRVRLSLILGSAFVIIWALAAAWMLRDLRQQMMFSLDQRLVASARMVAGLIDQLPQPLTAKGGEAHFSADQFSVPDGMACQVSSLRGEILASNHKHDGVMDAGTKPCISSAAFSRPILCLEVRKAIGFEGGDLCK